MRPRSPLSVFQRTVGSRGVRARLVPVEGCGWRVVLWRGYVEVECDAAADKPGALANGLATYERAFPARASGAPKGNRNGSRENRERSARSQREALEGALAFLRITEGR